jgi:hypothetical protein
MQVKTTRRYYFTAVRMTNAKIMSAGENVGKKEPLHNVGGKVNQRAIVENNMEAPQKK